MKQQKRGRGSAAGMSAVARGVGVMEYLAGCPSGAPVTEISRALGIEISVVSRLLGALEGAGCLRRSPDAADRYLLTWRIAAMAYRFVDSLEIPKAFLPELQGLAATAEELVQLAVVEEDCMRFIAKADVDQRITLRGLVGRVAHPDSMATGRAWLAWLSDADRRRVLAARTGDVPVRSHPDAKELERQLAKIRSDGYAIETAANKEDVVAIAAPVWAGNPREVVGVVSISGPSYRLPNPRLRALVRPLQETAERIAAIWPAILLRTQIRPLTEPQASTAAPKRARKA